MGFHNLSAPSTANNLLLYTDWRSSTIRTGKDSSPWSRSSRNKPVIIYSECKLYLNCIYSKTIILLCWFLNIFDYVCLCTQTDDVMGPPSRPGTSRTTTRVPRGSRPPSPSPGPLRRQSIPLTPPHPPKKKDDRPTPTRPQVCRSAYVEEINKYECVIPIWLYSVNRQFSCFWCFSLYCVWLVCN